MEYFAHSPNDRKGWHDLVSHLRKVAERAADFARPFGGEELAYWTGLWHDLGKFRAAFQAFIRNTDLRRSLDEKDHKSAGAIFAVARAELLAFPIIGVIIPLTQ